MDSPTEWRAILILMQQILCLQRASSPQIGQDYRKPSALRWAGQHLQAETIINLLGSELGVISFFFFLARLDCVLYHQSSASVLLKHVKLYKWICLAHMNCMPDPMSMPESKEERWRMESTSPMDMSKPGIGTQCKYFQLHNIASWTVRYPSNAKK
jgi:hypothetical protein